VIQEDNRPSSLWSESAARGHYTMTRRCTYFEKSRRHCAEQRRP
jgi:hypothetical protein